MTGGGDGGPNRDLEHPEDLSERSRALAFAHQAASTVRGSKRRAYKAPDLSFLLAHASGYFASPSSRVSSPAHAKAAEWYLDNYYLIRRVARQVKEELPPGFAARLAQLEGAAPSVEPRIKAIAEAFIETSLLTFDVAVLRQFIDAYQEVQPLSIAELWALPTMLRIAVLAHLLGFLSELGLPAEDERTLASSFHRGERRRPDLRPLQVDPSRGVENSIRTLRVLDVIDWKAFFEATSRVEAILSLDPSNVYSHMDFQTCDAYRKVVEALAWETGKEEELVARLAVGLATDGGEDERRRHVGYHLVAEGRANFERQLGYRARGVELLRRHVRARPTLSYLVPLTLLTWLPAAALGVLAATHSIRDPQHFVAIALATCALAVPMSSIAIAIIQSGFARLVPPQTLPKLDFRKGLPASARTLVAIPTLLGRSDDVLAMLRQIELHYLANPDPELRFALLTDDMDATLSEGVLAARPLLEAVAAGIAALNTKHAREGVGPFHLLHRERMWNPKEQRFMGWERKRGKLDELNRLLRGDTNTSYSRHEGAPQGLLGVRFVITLDSDTELPMEGAHRLVGLLAHPLNCAVFDDSTGAVIAGYTIAQPRIATSPSSARPSVFASLFAGDVGFDIYTHACSELYQDLFGSGIYVGKGIYEIDGFMRSTHGCAPENSLVSHDLFEGVHGRTALATDIVLYETFPSSYATYALRMHRWIRGDWQLLPWLLPTVPSAGAARLPNRLSLIDLWKITDNLRRSVGSPVLLLLLLFVWTYLPALANVGTAALLGTVILPSVTGLVHARHWRPKPLGRAVLALVFLPYEASIVLDAIARVLFRKVITGRHLLEWTTAAHLAFKLGSQQKRRFYWQTMAASPIFAAGLTAVLAVYRTSVLTVAWPLLGLWVVAPEIARAIGQSGPGRSAQVPRAEQKTLRLLARRTWSFFDMFVGPGDQWLPIDNYQEPPHEQTAHRTSPTNIGLMLTATLSAYDFGYVGPTELSLRLRRTFDSIARMQHHRGHLLNWYDTKTLEPLLPRYVSTVDSGNFAGCLLALAEGCKEVAVGEVVRKETWKGLRDSLDLFEEIVAQAHMADASGLLSAIGRVRDATVRAETGLDEAHAVLMHLSGGGSADLDEHLLAFLEAGGIRHEADILRSLRTSVERFHRHLQQMRREEHALLPWLSLATEATAHGLTLPTTIRLHEIPGTSRRLRAELAGGEARRLEMGESSPPLDVSASLLDAAFRDAESAATLLGAELLSIAALADAEMRGMDFNLLYDAERRLLHIGYNATSDQLDAHHYDLLASEARLASYLAIVKRDVPEAHWYALGRPMTEAAGSSALLSWGGTMFEYLMPDLLMRSQEGTLLDRTCEFALDAQIAVGKQRGEPWGVSESAYARLDAGQTYQYRSFGVPGLGFKRGLEEDRVVTPYASVLGVGRRPREVVANVHALEALGMRGEYGLFEAVDFGALPDPASASHGASCQIIRSYMAHHQGMLLVSLGNFLNRRSMRDRFHANALVESAEILLNEQAPPAAPAEWPSAKVPDAKPVTPLSSAPPPPPPWTPLDSTRRQAFVLSNDRLTSLVTTSGGGGLSWQGLAVTRYVPDATHDKDGLWVFLRDEETGEVWRATSSDCRTSFEAHRAEFHLRQNGISAHLELTVAAVDDVELRHVTLRNETDKPRRLTVTSAGRPLLCPANRAESHPAFVSLFIESEWIPAIEGLLFTRRPQSLKEEHAVLAHRLVAEGDNVSLRGYETDRGVFLGRATGSGTPLSLARGTVVGRGQLGAVLDPIMSVSAGVHIAPKGSVTLAFVTTVARSRRSAIELAKKYGSMHAVRWAVRDADLESGRRLHRAELPPSLLPVVQQLFSALLFVDPTLRPPRDVRAAAAPCQRRLWGLGISGDDAIVVVRVHAADAAILREVLSAQRYLRTCGVRIDVVLIDELPSGYVTEGPKTVRSVIAENGGGEWIDRHGGIFIVNADRTSEGDLRHLEACARVVLSTREPSLGAFLTRAVESPPKLPLFEPTLSFTVETTARPRPPLQLDNGLGGFSEDGREYVIDLARGGGTPAPWCNVIANPTFGCMVSESSLGTTWSENSGENRLTPWRNDPVEDAPSEVLYLRDEETADVWSSTPLPAGRDTMTRVRHGAGYTVYERESHGLVQTMTVFVAPDAPVKVVLLRLRNTLPRHRRVTATYYAEWVLGSVREKQRPYIVSEFDRQNACLLATSSWSSEFQGRVAFMASGAPVHGFSTDRSEFLGAAGNYGSPEGLERWGLSGRSDIGSDPCAALQVHIDLPPGAETETHFLLGQCQSREEALACVARFRAPAAVALAWTELGSFWDRILGAVQVKTPEPAMDLMLNRWLLYQSLSARIFGRSGFYQSSGAYGYRDQLQDVLALFHSAPEIARAHILESARHQFEEGDVLHWWHPPSGRGVRTRCSDDMAWLPYVAGEYVEATGDVSILSEPVPFLHAPKLGPAETERYSEYERSSESAPLLEHCLRAILQANTRGAHGLPLMKDGDWNDGMNRVGSEGRGESVWLGWFVSAAMDRFSHLAARTGDATLASTWTAEAKSLRTTVRKVAWDGAWYLRAFHDDGSLVGSAGARECRIDSIVQSWAVLSTPANEVLDDRSRKAVTEADLHLVRERERLVLLFAPPFDRALHDPGYIRAYPRGIRENGGQYSHASTWLGFAHALLGDGEHAARIFRLLNPALRGVTAEATALYRVEPYVIAADIYSCTPSAGRGGWTWYTGSASWMWRLGVEAILGIRVKNGQLSLDPCIPPSWGGFEAWVGHGAGRVHVVVENPDRIARGVAAMTIDGVATAGNVIDMSKQPGGLREVRVRLGTTVV